MPLHTPYIADLDAETTRHTAVLCVDLDYSLIATDILWESVLALARKRPFALFLLPLWWWHGKAYLKRKLASEVVIRPELLPYREDVLSYLRAEKTAGRKIILATATDELVARKIAEHLQLFDLVFASDGVRNLKGHAKAELLDAALGESSYAYLGDASSDLPVWEKSASALVVARSPRIVRRAGAVSAIERLFPIKRTGWKELVMAVRPHQWSKNILLLLPLALSHRADPASWFRIAIAFVLFSMAASAGYVLNDLFDVECDRAHPWKRLRPFASGTLSIPAGVLLCAGLLACSLGLGALAFDGAFVLVTGLYVCTSLFYSLYLKSVALLDVFALASFYTFRVVLGAAVVDVRLSLWLIAFSNLFFFSLALSKRYSELMQAHESVAKGTSGRGYRVEDQLFLAMFGASSSIAAIVVLELYMQSGDVLLLYRHPTRLVLLGPVLMFWISRVWLKSHRGELKIDPVLFALRDRVSYIIGCIALAVIGASMVR